MGGLLGFVGEDLVRKLSNSVKKLFVKKLTQIIKNPQIGKDLGNKIILNYQD